MASTEDMKITYVYMWGDTSLTGEYLENNETAKRRVYLETPIVLNNLDTKRITSVCCANRYALALTAYGQVLMWGNHLNSTPVNALDDTFVTKIATNTPGGSAVIFGAIDKKGDLYVWGPATLPNKVPLSTPVQSVALGENWAVAITTDSLVHSWFDIDRQIVPIHSLSPTQLGGAKVVKVGAGVLGFGAALASDNTLYTWGISRGPSGGNFLGHGASFEGLNQGPKAVEQLRNRVKYFECGYIHMMAVTLDDEVYGWGDGDTNRLGHGLEYSKRHRDTPTLIPALCGKGVKKLSLTRGSEAALTSSGEVYLWGGYDFGGHYKFETPTLMPMDTLAPQDAIVDNISTGGALTVLIVSIPMSLKHQCLRVISFNLKLYPTCPNVLPPELRETMANFLADRKKLDEEALSRLGLDASVVPKLPGSIRFGEYYYDGYYSLLSDDENYSDSDEGDD